MGNYTSSSDDLMMGAFLICAFLYSGVSSSVKLTRLMETSDSQAQVY